MKSEPRSYQTPLDKSPATNAPSTGLRVVMTSAAPVAFAIVEDGRDITAELSRRDVLDGHDLSAHLRRLRDEAAGRCGR